MKIYFIKIAFRGVSPMIWRRLRVPGTTSLARLHGCIQIVNGWDDFYLHQFHIYGRDYGTSNSGGISHAFGANKVNFDDFDFQVGDKFTYEYNFFEHNVLDIRIESIKDLLANTDSISCISGSGMPGTTKWDINDVKFEFLKKIVAQKGKLTDGDIIEFRENINQVKFNKRQANIRFSEVA